MAHDKKRKVNWKRGQIINTDKGIHRKQSVESTHFKPKYGTETCLLHLSSFYFQHSNRIRTELKLDSAKQLLNFVKKKEIEVNQLL